MGSAVSRLVRRSAQRAYPVSEAADHQLEEMKRKEIQRRVALQQQLQSDDDNSLDQQLSQLVSAISSREATFIDEKSHQKRRPSAQDKEQQLAGRVTLQSLKSILEDYWRPGGSSSSQRSATVQIAELSKQWQANESALQNLIKYTAPPIIEKASDGRLVGSWPRAAR